MRDPRLDTLANVLVNYSTAVKKDDFVRINGELPALPLMEAIYEKVLQAGGNPFVQITTDTLDDIFYRTATDEQLAFINPINPFMVDKIDVSIGIWAEENTKSMTNVDPRKQSLSSQARKPFLKRFLERAAKKELRWSGTQFPTNAAAQDAEMSLREYADFVFRAGLLHLPDPIAAWKKVSETQQRLVDFLSGKKEVHIVGKETDIRFGIEGRTWVNCDGHENFPDGEVFTGPIEDATEGTIRYSFPAVHHGRECHDIVLTFKAGKVVVARGPAKGSGLSAAHDRAGSRREDSGGAGYWDEFWDSAVHEEHTV